MKEIKGWRNKNWRVNIYVCKSCQNLITTVDVDEGTTPFMILCPKCRGDAQSNFYPQSRPIPKWIKPPIFEWFKPKTNKEILHYSKLELKEHRKILESKGISISVHELYRANKEHCKQGGLLMRKRTNAAPINNSVKNDCVKKKAGD